MLMFRKQIASKNVIVRIKLNIVSETNLKLRKILFNVYDSMLCKVHCVVNGH